MSPALRLDRSTVLATASVPVAATWWSGQLAVAASDLETQAAALWLVDDGEPAAPEPLPLAHVTGMAAFSDRLVVTGWSRKGEQRLMVGYGAGSTSEPIRIPVRGDVARDPRPIVTSAGVLLVWEEYAGDGLRMVEQAVRPDGRQGWRLDAKAVRRPAQPFAAAADAAAWGDGLIAARADEAGTATVERLDDHLRPQASAELSRGRTRVAVAGGDRGVVVSAGRAGEPVVVQSFDEDLAQIGDPVTLPAQDKRGTLAALAVSMAGDAPFAAVVQVETVLDDPETIGVGAEARLGPPPRRTTEHCTLIDLETGHLSSPYRLDPPSYGGAVIVWHLDRLHLVHGSSPLHVSELAVTR